MTGRLKSGDSDEFDRRLGLVNPNIKRLEKLKRAKDKIRFHCLLHDHIQLASPDKMLAGQGLSCCRIAASRKDAKRKLEEGLERFKLWLAINAPDYTVKGAYKGVNEPVEIYCSMHNRVCVIAPMALRAGKTHLLECCVDELIKSTGTNNIRSAMKVQNNRSAFVLRLKNSNPDLEVVGDYQGQRKPILFRCKKHGEVHLASPGNVLKGHGLKCCAQKSIRVTSEKRLKAARATYDKRIARIGRVQRLGEYQGFHVPILHRCIEHGEEHLARPGKLLAGGGLMCCGDASLKATWDKKFNDGRVKFLNELQSKVPYITMIGSYKGASSLTLFRCDKHAVEQLSTPSSVLRHKALGCCRKAKLKEIAQDRARSGDIQFDDFWSLISAPLSARLSRPAELYVFEMKRFPGLLKVGIAYSFKDRQKGSRGEYAKSPLMVWYFDCRRDAILVELAVKQQTKRFWDAPSELDGWPGFNELRRVDPKKLISSIQFIYDEFQSHRDLGHAWEEWALLHLELSVVARRALAKSLSL